MRTVSQMTAQRVYNEPFRVDRSWRVSPDFKVFFSIVRTIYPEVFNVRDVDGA